MPDRDRFTVKRPEGFGHAYFEVQDRASKICPNFAVATFSRHMPDAAGLAMETCNKLNDKYNAQKTES